jgi:phage-related baseplate assembly protein
MSVTFSLSSLFTAATRAEIYNLGLSIASSLGLPVTSWLPGDPTRSVYHFLAAKLEATDAAVAEYMKGGYLDSAEDDWLTVLADQQFNVQRQDATAASGDLVLQNTGGGVFYWDAGDLTFRSSTTDKTYHNTTSGSLTANGETITVSWVADEAGSDSSAGTDEIDELVSAMPGVVITSSTAGAATDEEEDEPLRQRCRASRGTLSPNGPTDAYRYVALTTELTGTTEVTKASVTSSSTTGTVQIVVAGQAGPVSGSAVAAVQDAIVRYCTPLTVTPSVSNSASYLIGVTIAVELRASAGVTQAQAEARIAAAIEDLISDVPVGGDGASGVFDHSLIDGVAFSVFGSAYTTSITRSLPATDSTDLGFNEVLALSAPPSVTVTFV